MKFVELLGDFVSSQLHSIQLELVDDVLVVLFLHVKKFLGLSGVATHNSASSGRRLIERSHTRVQLSSTEPRGLGELLEEGRGSGLSTWLVLTSRLSECSEGMLVVA